MRNATELVEALVPGDVRAALAAWVLAVAGCGAGPGGAATGTPGGPAGSGSEPRTAGVQVLPYSEHRTDTPRAIEGHLFVERLVCPSGASATPIGVISPGDPQGITDLYVLMCPDGKSATVRFGAAGSAQPPPGFRLLDKGTWEEAQELDGLLDAQSGSPDGGRRVREGASRLVERWPGVVRFLRLRALASFLPEEYGDAASDLNEVVRRDPDPMHRLERATAVKMAGDPAGCLAELVEIRKEVRESWSHYPEPICRIGAQRLKDGDSAGLPDVEKACNRGFEPCCEILKERSTEKEEKR